MPAHSHTTEKTPPIALRAVGIARTYGKGAAAFTALNDIDLSIARGRSVAIVGKSGSGKSTLMHLLALLDRPTRGDIEVEGASAMRLRPRELNTMRNRAFGFVFQQFFLTAGQTVFENVSLPLVIAGVPAVARRERVMDALDALGLADKAKNKATDLSGGQKQRVVIARALVNEPSVIFADEPTGNLDSHASGEVLGFLRRSVDSLGQSVVMVTHDPRAASYAHRVLFLADGELVAELRSPTQASVLDALAHLDGFASPSREK